MTDIHLIEKEIFNCPFIKSNECQGRYNCHPIPGFGAEQPQYLVLGLNPALRNGVWQRCEVLEDVKQLYFQECINSRYPYGRFLKALEGVIPTFRIPEMVYLSDIAKCPVIKGTPAQAMLKKCKATYLEKTIQALKPKFIIAFGSLSTKLVGGYERSGQQISSFRIDFGTDDCWLISAPHPSWASTLRAIASSIHKAIENPELFVVRKIDDTFSTPRVQKIGFSTEIRLYNFGYRKKGRGNSFVKGERTIHVCYSSEFEVAMRILWKEQWKNDYATIFDYSSVDGPVCIVPLKILFESLFVKQKRAKGYEKSLDWWSQRFPHDHELSKIVLGFKDRWDLL